MKRTLLLIAGITIATAAAAVASSKTDQRLVSAHTTFGFDLLHQLSANPGKNVFISPSSIATALEMTYNGASGQTKAEMAKTLHVDGLAVDAVNRSNQALRTSITKGDPKVKVAIANSLWAQKDYPFLRSFLLPVRRFYAAALENVVFGPPATTKRINTWVEKQTNGKITNLLPSLSPLTRLVLVNAVYFHGKWTTPFKKSATQPRDFVLQNGSAHKVPMMFNRGGYRYLKGAGFQAIRLPYGSGQFAMYVVLPNDTVGLTTLLKQANASAFNAWIRQMRPSDGEIYLPRFKVEYSKALNDPLQALGMRQPFDQSTADFSQMTGHRDLYISLVQHKAYVDVQEEGTEAAAATAVVMVARSMAPTKPGFEMIVDHPFLCAIRDDKTGEILFLGAIYDPTK